MSVNLEEGTHYHVGANAPGYSPGSDPICLNSLDVAIDLLGHAVKDQQDFYYERCEEGAPEECECPWCDAAGNCEGVLGSIADGDAQYCLSRYRRVYFRFHPDHGPDITHWVTRVPESRDDCELNEDDL